MLDSSSVFSAFVTQEYVQLKPSLLGYDPIVSQEAFVNETLEEPNPQRQNQCVIHGNEVGGSGRMTAHGHRIFFGVLKLFWN